jgi:hypothetical protein
MKDGNEPNRPQPGVQNRRKFLRGLMGNAVVMWDEISGIPQLNMAELPELPAETLGQIKPLILAEVKISVGENDVKACLPQGDRELELFPIEPANLFVFNLFNGILCLDDIAAKLADFMDWSKDMSLAHTRGLFLHLVHLGICVPGNPIADD